MERPMHDAVAPEELEKWHRWFAIECNNRAWRLAEIAGRTAAEDVEMLRAAHAAAFHWDKVGTELHRARALMLLAHVHALLGQGQTALEHATRSFEFVQANESPPWEVAFAHMVLANAAFAAGESELHSKHYLIARQMGMSLPAEERSVFQTTFSRVPQP
jgi:hypothetical protein